MNERINDLNMTVTDVIVAMAGGNPGAVVACAEVMKKSGKVDPDSALGGLGALMLLDTLNIWEHRIWMLYKDVCKHDVVKMLAVLRAYQLGQLAGCTESAINHAIDNCGDGIDLDAVLAAVKKRLVRFSKDEK